MPRRPRHQLPAGYWTIWTTVALDLVGFGIVVPILGRYAERFGASGFEVGLLFAVYSLAQFAFAPLLGRLSDRIGRKPVIVISLLGTAVGSVITGLAGSLWVLFLGRIVDGASGGSLSVAQAAVADIAPEGSRERLIGGLGAAFGVGFVLGPALGALSALRGPHVPFYVAAAIAGLNAIAAIVRLPETRRPRHHAVANEPMPRTRVLRRLAFVGFVTTVAFVAFEATFSLFGNRRFGLGEAGSSVVFLCIGVLLVAIQGGGYGRLVERAGVARLYRTGLIVMLAGLAAMALATVWPLLIVALGLLAFGQSLTSPAATSLVARHAPEHLRGQALGFQQSAYSFGRMLGPPAAGALFDRAVWSPYIAGAALVAIALVLATSWRLLSD